MTRKNIKEIYGFLDLWKYIATIIIILISENFDENGKLVLAAQMLPES